MTSAAAGPVFVVGVGRSGTSLVQSMLAAHSALAFPPEFAFVRRYLAQNRLSREARRVGIPGVRRLLGEDAYIARLGLDLDDVLAEAGRGPGGPTDAVIYRRILEAYARRQGKPRVGDKDPRSVEYLALLHHHFPDAFIVHVLRDPRDILASKKKAAWSRDRSAWMHIAAGAMQARIGRRTGPRLFGGRYREVQYEQLLSDPERIIRGVLEALELPFEPVHLRFSDAARVLVTPAELSWKKETLGGLLPDNSGKWRSELSPCEAHVAMLVNRLVVGRSAVARPGPRTRWQRGADWPIAALLASVAMSYDVYRHWAIRRAIRAHA